MSFMHILTVYSEFENAKKAIKAIRYLQIPFSN